MSQKLEVNMPNTLSKMYSAQNGDADDDQFGGGEDIQFSQSVLPSTSDNKKRSSSSVVSESSSVSTSSSSCVQNGKSDTRSVKKFKSIPRYPLILVSIYDLNSSCSKRVAIGLESQDDGDFRVVLRFMDNKSRGISLPYEDWLNLQQKFDIITDYLSGHDSINRPPPIKVGSTAVFFTTSYNTRAILIGKVIDDISNEDELRNINCLNNPKKESYLTSNIFMQLATFEGLCKLVACIDERCRHLRNILDNVNLLKKVFVSELCYYLEQEKIVKPCVEFINQLLNVKFGYFKEKVKSKLPTDFVNKHFEIVFCEFSTILTSFLSDNVKENMFQKLQEKKQENNNS